MTAITNINTSLAYITPDTLKPIIDSFILELKARISADRDNELTDADYSRSCELLKAALDIAGNDPARIAQIKQAFDAYNVDNDILGKLISNNHVWLAHLLIDLQVAEMFVTDQASPLQIAVEEGNQELTSHLLKYVDPNANLSDGSALYKAVAKANRKIVEQLLRAGANPNLKSPARSTPFEYAVIFNDISLIHLFFDSTICHFDVDPTRALELLASATHYKLETDKSQKKSYNSLLSLHTRTQLDSDYEKEHRTKYYDWQKSFALTLPPLADTIPCYAPYVAHRDKAIHRFLDPILNFPLSVSFYITPVMKFVSKETQEDPKFTIVISKKKGDDEGMYHPKTGKIDLYIPQTEQPFKDLSEIPDTTLIHEICHKIFHKTPQKMSLLRKAVRLDSASLEQDNWRNCHPSVKELLRSVKRKYTGDDIYEEYLVRTMEIMSAIADEDRTRTLSDIKVILRRDLPETFKYIQNPFWVNLSVYNRS